MSKSSRPRRTRDAFDERSAEALREMLHRSPREFGRQRSLRTLQIAAEVAFEEGITKRRVSGQILLATLSRLLGEIAESETLDHFSRPLVRKKKRRRDRLMAVAEASPKWAISFEDECWCSRLAQPTLSSWAEQGKPMRLVQQSVAKDDPEPKAIYCYGLYVPQLDERWLRFVEERPVRSIRADAPSNNEFIKPDYCVLQELLIFAPWVALWVLGPILCG